MTIRHLAAAAATALLIAGCGSDDSDAGKAGEKYPEDSRKAFLDSCDAQPSAERSVCECALEKIEATVSFNDFSKADKALREGKEVDAATQAKFEDATTECSKG